MVKFDHMNLPVTNYQVSRDWYVRNFGFKVEFEVPDRKTSAIQDDGGFTIFVYEQPSQLSGAKCSLTLQVEDVDSKFKELKSKGVAFVNPPGKYFWGYGAELRDPDGYQILLVGRSLDARKRRLELAPIGNLRAKCRPRHFALSIFPFTGCRGHPCPRRCGTHGGFHIQ